LYKTDNILSLKVEMRIIIFYMSGANKNFHKILVRIPNGEKPYERHRCSEKIISKLMFEK
jgi:hypothetical protein